MSESPKKYGGYRIISIRETLASEDVLAIGFVGRSALPALIEEIERLREALTFYANPAIYKPHPHGPAFDDRDLSYHARSALSDTTGEG